MRYEHILHEGHETITTIMIGRLPNSVLDIQTVRAMNQALQEVSKHQRELKPLVPTHVGNKAVMEKRKPVGKGA